VGLLLIGPIADGQIDRILKDFAKEIFPNQLAKINSAKSIFRSSAKKMENKKYQIGSLLEHKI